MNTDIFGHIAAFITIIIWSLTFVQTKILLKYLDPVEILLDRFVVAWIIFLIFSKKNIKINFKDEMYFILLGATGIFGYYILENIALKYSSAINVGLIVTTAPVFTVILSMLRARPPKKTIKVFWGVLLVILGLATMGYGKVQNIGLGDFLALMGAVSFGLYSVLLESANKRYDIATVTRKSFLWGSVFLMIFATIQQIHWNWEAYTNHVVMGNILFLSIVASGICFFMWRWAILRIGATQTSNYIYLVPIINSIAAGFILKEEITIQLFIAGVLILSGLYVSQKYSLVGHY